MIAPRECTFIRFNSLMNGDMGIQTVLCRTRKCTICIRTFERLLSSMDIIVCIEGALGTGSVGTTRVAAHIGLLLGMCTLMALDVSLQIRCIETT